MILDGALDRREVVAELLKDRKDLLVVTGLGSASYDVMAIGDHDNNFYLWAAMGSAAMVGLGLAKAQPNKSVLVITGDGELMMGLGSLATIAVAKPVNLTIAVIDNGTFGVTGMQVSHSGRGIDIAKLAAGIGFAWTDVIRDMSCVADLRGRIAQRSGPQLATIKVSSAESARIVQHRDGVHVKNRFRSALGYTLNG